MPADIDVGRELAGDSPDGRGQRLENAQVDAVAAGMYRKGTVHLALFCSTQRQVQRKGGSDIQHVLARPPKQEIRLQPAIGVVNDTLEERRAKIAESASIQRHSAPQRRPLGRSADADIQPELAGHTRVSR